MNKTDRLLAIVLELQRKAQRAEDLAAVFETSVRTIYRDMQALSEAGVPVVGAPGQGYALVDGYFLPPISFTGEEAARLLLGIDFVEQQLGADYAGKVHSVRSKIEAVLPKPVHRESERQRAGMKLIAADASKRSDCKAEEELALLRGAILEERIVRFCYSTPGFDGSRQTEREADPYGLVYIRGSWVLIAYCHLRQELRHFRVQRMKDLSLLEEGFVRPLDFDLRTYKPADDRNMIVRVLLRSELADRAVGEQYFYMESAEPSSEGLLVTLRVRKQEDVLHWVLGWGAGAVVLEPESLRLRVREEIENMRKRY